MTLKYLTEDDLDSEYDLVQSTITECYLKYYAPGIVKFFCTHHSKERMVSDLRSGKVYGIYNEDVLAATGTIDGNHITRVRQTGIPEERVRFISFQPV